MKHLSIFIIMALLFLASCTGNKAEKTAVNIAEAINKLLPTINTVYVQNDSIARLDCAESSAYIVLRKATEKK